jgi:hypothetical protein
MAPHVCPGRTTITLQESSSADPNGVFQQNRPTAADRVSSTVRYRERQTRGQTCRGADRRSLLANGSGADTVNPSVSATTGILAASPSSAFALTRHLLRAASRRPALYLFDLLVEREGLEVPSQAVEKQDIRSCRSSIRPQPFPHRISACRVRLVGHHPTKLSVPDAMRQPLKASPEESPSGRASQRPPVSRSRQPAFRWSTNGTSSSTRS